MGVDLSNDAGDERCYSGTAWDLILNLAEEYGWAPAGTVPPEGTSPDEWDGSYDASCGQSVHASDAQALAAALRKAAMDPALSTVQQELARALSVAIEAATGQPVELAPLDDVAILWDLIAFLEQGRFLIE